MICGSLVILKANSLNAVITICSNNIKLIVVYELYQEPGLL